MRAGLACLLVASLVACDDDTTGDKSSGSQAPEPSKEGGLFGNAVFTYKCLSPSDAQCDNDALGTGAGGSTSRLPQIAEGSTFALTPQLTALAPPGDPPVITALHPTFATVNGEAITAVKEGYTTLGFNRGAEVVDLLNVEIVKPDGMHLASADPTSDFKDLSVSGGGVKATATFTFRFRALPGKGSAPLAGSFPCLWTTSDKDIANITTDATDNIVTIVTGTKQGTATIHVTLGPYASDIPLTVGG